MDRQLANIPLFAGLEEHELAVIYEGAKVKGFPRNTIVIHEGDDSDSLFLILSGRVTVFLTSEKGREVILNTQSTGEYFGELALLDDLPRSASVMTVESSQFCVISKTAFQKVLAHHPAIALQVIKNLTQRIRALTDNVKNLALLDVYGRVARTLLRLAVECEDEAGKMVVEPKPTHQDIGKMVGASREMVTRIMKDLVVGGYVHVEHGRIVIHQKLPRSW
ncbi:MAG: Crp/Fnr family transcriptional regulator [Thiotrichaceae bacterium]|nr:Crp/Fnr family transcriptional regulator [Thiotrichaceae bacterium]